MCQSNFFFIVLFGLQLAFSISVYSLETVGGSKDRQMMATYLKPEKNGIRIGKPVFRYDFSNLRKLQLGPYLFSFKDFKVNVATLHSTFSSSSKYEYAYAIGFQWPKEFATHGELYIETFNGVKKSSYQVSEESYKDWKEQLSKIRQGEKLELADKNALTSSVNNKDPFPESPWGKIVQSKWSYLDFKIPFRFCIFSEKKNGFSKICSPFLGSDENGRVRLRRWKRTHPSGVVVRVNGEQVLERKSLDLHEYQELSFEAQFDNGMLIAFERKGEEESVIVEISQDLTEKKLWVNGYGAKPHRAYWQGKTPQESSLWQKRYPNQTAGQTRYYWEMSAALSSVESRSLALALLGADVIEYPLEFVLLPPRKAKFELVEEIKETYDRFPEFYGNNPQQLKVTVADPSEIDFLVEHKKFHWEYYAPHKGQFNEAALEVDFNGKKWKSFYDIYRGYSSDLSLRLDSVASSQGAFSFWGELRGSYWFEDLLGWSNPVWSTQRWGLDLRFLKSLTKMDVLENSSEEVGFSFLDLGLRYRFQQGLWSRSKTWGAEVKLLSGQFELQSESIDFSVPGFGLFLSQPAFSWWDSALNIFPFFRSPKFMDIKLSMTLPKDLSQAGQVNQLGTFVFFDWRTKIMPSSRFFYEFDWGLDYFKFSQQPSGREMSLLAFKLGLGLGMNY